MTKTENKVTVRLTTMGLLIALIIMLTCLPIQTLGLEITLAMIPIAVGAVVLGSSSGAILGGIYGLCSFAQCFGLLKPSAFGASMLALDDNSVIYVAIICIVPRILCGLGAGLVYSWLSKFDKTKIISHATACLICPLLNTVLFMSAIMLFFGNSELIQGYMEILGIYNPFFFVLAFVGINGLVEAVSCFILATAISKILTSVIRFR